MRLINAATATIFRVAHAGHRLTVTHADGQPVESVEVDAVRIGQGERYDVLVDADTPGIWQLAAQAEGTGMAARALVHYEGSTGAPPPENALPAELGGKLLSYDQLKARASVSDLQGESDQAVPVILTGDEDQYVWMINNQTFSQADPVSIARGRHIRFQIANKTGMPHPMHLHGHFFQVNTGTGQGPLKDTVLVDPSQEVVIDWRATNPGDWAFHCHHLYHAEAGMMQVVRVT